MAPGINGLKLLQPIYRRQSPMSELLLTLIHWNSSDAFRKEFDESLSGHYCF